MRVRKTREKVTKISVTNGRSTTYTPRVNRETGITPKPLDRHIHTPDEQDMEDDNYEAPAHIP